MSPTAFIALLLPIARSCQREYGVPSSITLAQAALESGWGEKALGNNLFGIKADASWTGPVVTFTTSEYINGRKITTVAKFRKYGTWDESVHDHAMFLRANKRYAPCFKEATAEGFAAQLQANGYATAPDYAKSVMAVIKGRNMTQYDK